MSTSQTGELVYGDPDKCAAAFSGQDGLLRVVSAGVRIGVMADFFSPICLDTTPLRNTHKELNSLKSWIRKRS